VTDFDSPSQPRTAGELAEVLEDMWDVLGSPETMESPHSRAIFLLNRTRLQAAVARELQDTDDERADEAD
jgi:hypothetical protein